MDTVGDNPAQGQGGRQMTKLKAQSEALTALCTCSAAELTSQEIVLDFWAHKVSVFSSDNQEHLQHE